MLWGIAFAVLIIALMIPLVAVLRDARLQDGRGEGRTAAGRVGRDTELEQLTKRVQLLEDELDDLGRAVDQVRDDTQFLQQLLENPARREEGPPKRPPR